MIARNQTFENLAISLDGGSFYGCTFNKCRLQFSGLLPVHLEGGNKFENCKWEFAGPASTTIGLMSALYKAGARDLIEATLRVIRGEETTGPISMRH
jgi:hypothetical protein